VFAGRVGELEIPALVRGLCSPLVVGFSSFSLVAVFFYDQVDFFWFRSLSFSFLGAVILLSHPIPSSAGLFNPHLHGMPPIE